MNLTIVRCCKNLCLRLLFLWLAIYFCGCSDAIHRVSSYEQGPLGIQIQKDPLKDRGVLPILEAPGDVRLSSQSSRVNLDVENVPPMRSPGSLLRRSSDSGASTLSLEVIPEVTSASPAALLCAQRQESCTPTCFPSHVNKVPMLLRGPFVLGGGKEVLFELSGDRWEARVRNNFLACEEVLPVICQKDVATVLAALRGAREVDVNSRIRIMALDRVPKCVYVGTLGVRGGTKQGDVAWQRQRRLQATSSIFLSARPEIEDRQGSTLNTLGDGNRPCVALHTSDISTDIACVPYETPIGLSRKACHYIPLLNKIDMIQNYLMDTRDSFEKHLIGLRDDNVEGWQEFIQISVANTCKVVDKLYAYIGGLVVGKITAEACLYNAIMCREDYLMSHASHIDAWLHEECYELDNIVEGLEDHFKNAIPQRLLLCNPQDRRVFGPLSLGNSLMENEVRELKKTIRTDIMGRDECRGSHGAPDQLKDSFNKKNSNRSPSYIPIPTDIRLFRLFFQEDFKTGQGIKELKEAIREDMIFRLDTINSIIFILFDICQLEQPFSEETFNLLSRASTRSLWSRLSGKKSHKIDHPDECTPLNALASLLEKIGCIHTTEPSSVFQKIILTAKLDDARCIFNYFKMKYGNAGAALLKTIHFAQSRQWLNSQAVKMYHASYAEADDMIGRIFLPYMNLGMKQGYPKPKQAPGVFALVSEFDRCRLTTGQTTSIEPDCLIPEEVGDWQTPTKNIFSFNHFFQVSTQENNPTDVETTVEGIYSQWPNVQDLHSDQKDARGIRRSWTNAPSDEALETMNVATEPVSGYSAISLFMAGDAQGRALRILSNKQEKVLINLFSDNAQLVKYRDYKNVWERLGGKIRSTAGGSHQELCSVNGDVLGGIFKHNNNQTYGKRCVEKLLRMPMRRLMTARNLHVSDGRVLHKKDSI